jgi:hypothetical protein
VKASNALDDLAGELLLNHALALTDSALARNSPANAILATCG